MPRVPVRIAPLTDETHAAFVDLWVARRAEIGFTPELSRRAVGDGRLAAALASDGVRILLAVVGEQPVGYAWVVDRPLSTLVDSPRVTVEDFYVASRSRRGGVGNALLVAAGAHAHRLGAEQLACAAPAQSRLVHRTLTRLGFAPAVSWRVAPTAALAGRRRRGPAPDREAAIMHRRRTRGACPAPDALAGAR